MNIFTADAADLRTALGTCMRNAELQALYKNAPEDAKPVLKILFYAAVFPEKVDEGALWNKLAEMEPALSEHDLEYLALNWDGKELREYFFTCLDARHAPKPKSVSKPKLGVIRHKENSAEAVDLNAEAVKRRMAFEAEEASALAAAEEFAWRRARRKEIARNVLVSSVSLCLLAAGAVWFHVWNEDRKAAREARMLEIEKARAKEAAELERKRESDAARREAEAAERALRRKEREEKAKARQAVAEREAEERREARELVKKRMEKIAAAESLFEGAVLIPWKSLPASSRPGATDGVFSCMLPTETGEAEFYEVDSKSSGEIAVKRLHKDAEPVDVEYDKWAHMLQSTGGIVGTGGSVYLFCPKEDDDCTGIPDAGICPSAIRLGRLCSLITRFHMDTDAFSFVLAVRLKGRYGSVRFGPVPLGETISRSAISEKVAERIKSSIGKNRSSSFRRTVVMYDGNIVKRLINGVTLVPENPLSFDNNYHALRKEALRQEEKAAELARNEACRIDGEVSRKTDSALRQAAFSVAIKY